MALELKPITKEGVPTALEKAQRYRLLRTHDWSPEVLEQLKK